MTVILNFLLSFLLLYKYVGLFLVSYLAAFLLPLPSSSTLAAAGAFSAQGYFDINIVLVVAFFGNVLGDITGYLIARKYGTQILRKIGFEKMITSNLYQKLELYMRDFSYSLIFFSRFLTGIGPLINVISGISKVNYKTFFIIDILGETAYVLLFAFIGYFLGTEWENNISFLLEATGVIITLGITIGLLQYGLFKRMKKLSLN